ncbi:MAG: sigma-70 family RNA polymerase sigma factor [Planctomycetota bacterium]|nr:sigma-70 family RNA polymerase sigma factor [Planctomycetota bacterium]
MPKDRMKANGSQLELNLIRRAQSGCRDSVSRLCRVAEKRLYAYIYRMTLDFHLTQDLCQETLLEMVEHLGELRIGHAPAFWAWLYKTALNKIRQHIRQMRHTLVRQSIDSLDDAALAERLSEAGLSACDKLIQQELVQAVVRAMAALKLNHRSVLLLRCFHDLSYVEIAEVMGGTQLRARLLFLRAKKSLRQQLGRNGLGGMHLVSGLTVFGAVTTGMGRSASTGVLIGQDAMRIGLGATVLGAVASKAGLIAAAAVFAVPVSIGLGGWTSGMSRTAPAKSVARPALEVSDGFSDPSRVSGSSESCGWTCIDLEDPGAPVDTDPPSVLVGRGQGDGVAVVLPEGDWVQLQFPDVLYDAPGADLLVAGADVKGLPEVAAVSDTNDLFILVPGPTAVQPSGVTVVPYDLAQVPAGVRLAAVRIRGLPESDDEGGFQLVRVQARTVGVRAPQTAQLLR